MQPNDIASRSGENPMVEKVSGYRRLTDAELQLVNDLKARGAQIEADMQRVLEVIQARDGNVSEQHRALALGKTNIQQGYMWLIRAVAAPNGLI